MIYLTDTISDQAYTFLLSIGAGALLGAFYDVFKLLHIIMPSKKTIVFIEDIIYWVISAFLSFIFILVFNSGEIRGYLLVGELCGFIIYYFLFSKYVVAVINFIYQLLKKFFKFIFKLIFAPFKFIFKIISRPFRWFGSKIKKSVKKIRNLQKNLLRRHTVLLYNCNKDKIDT